MIADRIISVESAGVPNARNPRSTAYGAGQFIEQTWLDMLAKHRPDLTTGKSRGELLALRADPSLSKEMTEAYAADNGRMLTSAGLPVTPGTTYLAHFAGPKGAVGLLQADPSAPAGMVLGEAALKANPFLQKMTVADLRSWADKKMGAAPDAQMSAPQQPQPRVAATEPQPEQQSYAAPRLASFGSLAPEPEVTPVNMKVPDIPIPQRRPFDLARVLSVINARPSSRAFS